MYRRVMEKVAQSDIDGYLVTNPKNINWLCNKDNYFLPGIILVTSEELYLFTRSRNFLEFKKMYSEYHVVFGGMDELYDLCQRKNVNVLGFESNLTSLDGYNQLKATMSGINLMSLPDFVEDIKSIKTNGEIELIKDAVELSDKAYVEFLNHLKTGITEKHAKNIFRNILIDMGADGLSFDIMISSGSRCFYPHSASTDKIIQSGDFVLMDFGIVLNGYCSDTTRTVVMENATEKQQEMYELVLRAQQNALNSIRAGMTAREADGYARDVIMQEISTGCYDYGLGHGIGMNVHEKPSMHPDRQNLLLKNMVVTVEPGIYIEGWGGIRIEDILVIEEDKPGRNLTGAPKEFTIIK